jgi:hypothetical protein
MVSEPSTPLDFISPNSFCCSGAILDAGGRACAQAVKPKNVPHTAPNHGLCFMMFSFHFLD